MPLSNRMFPGLPILLIVITLEGKKHQTKCPLYMVGMNRCDLEFQVMSGTITSYLSKEAIQILKRKRLDRALWRTY